MIHQDKHFQFYEEVRIKGEPVQMLVGFTVDDEGVVQLDGTCTRSDSGETYSVINWQQEFKDRACELYKQITHARLALALAGKLYGRQEVVV